jgi:putative addiction module killer protein
MNHFIKIRKADSYQKWFDKLSDTKAKSRIRIRIKRLEAGNPGDAKAIGNGLSEMRIDYGPGYRVYYQVTGDSIILLWGGDKSTQDADIARAKYLVNLL